MEPKLIKMEPKWNRNTKLDSISSANEVPHSYPLSNGRSWGYWGVWGGAGQPLRADYSCRMLQLRGAGLGCCWDASSRLSI